MTERNKTFCSQILQDIETESVEIPIDQEQEPMPRGRCLMGCNGCTGNINLIRGNNGVDTVIPYNRVDTNKLGPYALEKWGYDPYTQKKVWDFKPKERP